MAIAAMAHDNDDPDIESAVARALELRSSYLKGHSDTLTLPAVRRLLEQDLGLKALHLDAHKALIKRMVDKVFNDAGDKDVDTEKPRKRRRKTFQVVEDTYDIPSDRETEPSTTDHGSMDKKIKLLQDVLTDQEKTSETNMEESKNQDNPLEEPREKVVEEAGKEDDYEGNATKGDKQVDAQEVPSNADYEMLEKEGDTKETPVKRDEETFEKQDNPAPEVVEEKKEKLGPPQSDVVKIDEDTIKAALVRRSDELKSQSESLTVKGIRRLLEEELGLELNALDGYKQLIRKLIDEFLGNAAEEPSNDSLKAGKATKEKAPGSVEGRLKTSIKSQQKANNMQLGTVNSPLHKRSEEHEESEEKRKGNGEVSGSESEERKEVKQRKKKTTEVKKKMVVAKKSVEVKRPFSSNVERLREIIKFLGLGISPAIYKRAKQAPEEERNEVLVKELENVLSREGLSPNPSDKEMRKVKLRLAKKRDLDGIESGNIVAEPRRSRGAANSWFSPGQSKYSQVKEISDKISAAEDSDDDSQPKITGLMDD